MLPKAIHILSASFNPATFGRLAKPSQPKWHLIHAKRRARILHKAVQYLSKYEFFTRLSTKAQELLAYKAMEWIWNSDQWMPTTNAKSGIQE